jgi:hypothetical protein
MTDNKYKNGKIYTIRHKGDNSLICVGYTNESRLFARLGKHKYKKNTVPYINTYKNMMEIGMIGI